MVFLLPPIPCYTSPFVNTSRAKSSLPQERLSFIGPRRGTIPLTSLVAFALPSVLFIPELCIRGNKMADVGFQNKRITRGTTWRREIRGWGWAAQCRRINGCHGNIPPLSVSPRPWERDRVRGNVFSGRSNWYRIRRGGIQIWIVLGGVLSEAAARIEPPLYRTFDREFHAY